MTNPNPHHGSTQASRLDEHGVRADVTAAARAHADTILGRFKAAVAAAHGSRLDRIVLFGSRARGDPHGDSDYDIAVFLKDLPDRWKEFDRLADLRLEFLVQTGAFFDALPFAATAYAERTPLMREIRREGLDL